MFLLLLVYLLILFQIRNVYYILLLFGLFKVLFFDLYFFFATIEITYITYVILLFIDRLICIS